MTGFIPTSLIHAGILQLIMISLTLITTRSSKCQVCVPAWARLTKQRNQSAGKQDLAGSYYKQLKEYSRPGWEFHAKGIW